MPASIADVVRCVSAAAVAAGVVLATVSPSAAADLLRRHHGHHRHAGLAAYQSDRACPPYEPRNYQPRTVNDPLCYAARPYGISMHLYDHSTLLDRVDDSGEY